MKKIINLMFMMMLVFLALGSGVMAAENDISDIDVSLVNQDPNPVVAGDIVEVRLGLENKGYSSANNVVIEAISEYPFEVISQKIQEVGSVQSTNTDSSNIQIVKFRLKVSKDISAGSYEFVVKEYSENSPNVVTEHTVEIDVKTKESLEIVSIDKSEILPGKKERVTFKLKNIGSSVLNDVVFSWENTDDVILTVGSDNSQYIKSIGVGEEVDISFDILASANAVADLYNLDLTVSYQDSIAGTTSDYVTKTGIYVGGDTSFDLIFDEVSGSEYAFTISNIGANNAESVTVKVPTQDGWKVNAGNSDIIGNLNKGDYTTVSFELTKNNVDSITLIVDYTNTLGERVSVEKQIDVFASTPTNIDGSVANHPGSQGGMGGMASGVTTIVTWAKYLGYGILALIVIFVGFRVYKKRRK